MEVITKHNIHKEISSQNIGKLLNEFIDIFNSPEDLTGGKML